MDYIKVNLDLSKNKQNKLMHGKCINLKESELNKGDQYMIHHLNYEKLKNKKLKNFYLSKGELLASAQNSGGSIFNDIGDFLKNNGSTILDVLSAVATPFFPVGSTVAREGIRALTGVGI